MRTRLPLIERPRTPKELVRLQQLQESQLRDQCRGPELSLTSNTQPDGGRRVSLAHQWRLWIARYNCPSVIIVLFIRKLIIRSSKPTPACLTYPWTYTYPSHERDIVTVVVLTIREKMFRGNHRGGVSDTICPLSFYFIFSQARRMFPKWGCNSILVIPRSR